MHESTMTILALIAVTAVGCGDDGGSGGGGNLTVVLEAEDTIPEAVSYTHLTLPTIVRECRSRWSPYH